MINWNVRLYLPGLRDKHSSSEDREERPGLKWLDLMDQFRSECKSELYVIIREI